MPSTDQMIADLVAEGFKLPEGLGYQIEDMGMTRYWTLENNTPEHRAPVPGQLAHDLCAMEFARQNAAPDGGRYVLPLKLMQMALGDTEAAIKALWEAVCGGTNES